MTSLKLSNAEGWNTQTKFYNELLREQKLTDVTLACDDGFQLGVHKTIISASSLFFRDVIVNSDNPKPFIYLRGVKQEILQSLLNFIYVGETTVETENVDDLVAIGNDLKVMGMMEMEVQDGTTRMEEIEGSQNLETPLNLTKDMKCEQDTDNKDLHSSDLATNIDIHSSDLTVKDDKKLTEKEEGKLRKEDNISVDTWKGQNVFPLLPVNPNNSKQFTYFVARTYLRKCFNILGFFKGSFKKYGEPKHKPAGWPEELSWTSFKGPAATKISEVKTICRALFKVHMNDINFDTYYQGAGGWKWISGESTEPNLDDHIIVGESNCTTGQD